MREPPGVVATNPRGKFTWRTSLCWFMWFLISFELIATLQIYVLHWYKQIISVIILKLFFQPSLCQVYICHYLQLFRPEGTADQFADNLPVHFKNLFRCPDKNELCMYCIDDFVWTEWACSWCLRQSAIRLFITSLPGPLPWIWWMSTAGDPQASQGIISCSP